MHRSKWTNKGQGRWSARRIVAALSVVIGAVGMMFGVVCVFYASYVAGGADVVGSVSKPSPMQSVTYPHMAYPVYRYSVVPGGVHSPRELQLASADDYVVRTLYNGVNFPLVHEHRLATDTILYISYRKGLHVFWTKGTHVLHAGEVVYTDGKRLVRARCGNLLSLTPRYPTEPTEPTVAELDSVLVARDPGSTVTPMLRSALSAPALTVALPRYVLDVGSGSGGRPCRHEDDGDSDDCRHRHHGPPPIPVPETETLVMVGTGLVTMYATIIRRRKA